MKKIFLSLLVVLLPMVAMADAVEIDGIYYNLISKAKEAEVTSNPNKYSGTVDIPASISFDGVEYSVTSIGVSAFRYCSSLTTVNIPNSVTSIGGLAFEGCSSLTSVTIPNSVTTIGASAFIYCSSLTSVTIPNSVTSIEGAAFRGCSSLTSVTIPNSVTSIGASAFENCSSLTSISIPNSVTSIGRSAFEGCSSLTSFTIPNSVTTIGGSAFINCSSLTSVTIPNSVTSIGESAFNGCSSLTSVTIPSSVTRIEASLFSRCISLNSVTIPNSVFRIEKSAFNGCSSLTTVAIPNSVTTIGESAFNGCSSLTSVTISNSVTTIYTKAFASCPELTDVFCLAEKVPSTMSNAFQGSYIEYATLHVPAASIGAYREAEPWKNFKSIVSYDGSETPKCATPTISYRNGELTYECETEGVEFVSTISDTDIRTHYDAKVQLSATYVITVYATKSGYDNSDVATATLCWIDQQPETEGIAEGLAQIPARPVLIKADCGLITIDGAADGTPILLFTTDGTLAASTTSQGGTATLAPHLPSGTAAIVRIGERSVKVVAK